MKTARPARGEPGYNLREWGTDIATRLAATVEQTIQQEPWHNTPLPGKQATAKAGQLSNTRSSADAANAIARFISSLPAGEKLSGVLR